MKKGIEPVCYWPYRMALQKSTADLVVSAIMMFE